MTWGKDLWDQFDSIAAHTLKGIEFSERISQFIKERCMIENEYAARLKKLVKNYQPKKKDEDTEWTSVKGFTAMITEVHDIAGQHEMIADNLGNTVVKELQNLVHQVKQDRKKHLAAGQKQQTALQLQLQSLDKCKKLYEKSFREAEKAQELFRKADADRHMSKADVEKAQNIMIQKQQHSEECKKEYASELQKTNECQAQHYTFGMTLIFEQLQEMEEKRIGKIQELLKSCADIEKDVLPIINTCISGMIKAADSVSFSEDSQAVIEKFKSGFVPPEDIPFEDLSNPLLERINNSTPSSVPHHSSQRLDSVRSSFSGGSVKAKRKTRLLNIFSGSKSDDIKEDYSHLPPNQQKKKLNQRIAAIKNSLAKETAERDGMQKMQDVYRQNPALGDPQSLSKQLEENGQKLDKLRLELKKFETYLQETENNINVDPKMNRFSTSLQGSPISSSHAIDRSDNKIGVSRNDSMSCSNFDTARISSQSATTDQDSFDDIDDDTVDGDLRPIGRCTALYPFDAPSEGSISMYEGEEFHIMEHDQGDGWMRVRRMNNLEEGFVPTSYVEIDKKSLS